MHVTDIPSLLRSFAASAGEIPCWPWPGKVRRDGYGYATAPRGVSELAHRHAYEVAVGTIPDGLTIDHLCRNRACINPSHLEPVTAAVNALRGDSPLSRNHRKTQCNRGHAFTPENTAWVTITGRKHLGRCCRVCRKENNDRSTAEKRAARGSRILKSHCIRGHPLTGSNVRIYGIARHCLQCRNERRQRRREAGLPVQ